MSWQKKPGHEHNHIDGRTGMHVVRLHNPVTDGEHLLQIRLGVDECSMCKRPFAKDDLGAVDPAAHLDDALTMLRANHEAIMRYAAKHNLPVKLGPSATLTPQGQTRQEHGGHKMLMPPPRRQEGA